MERRPVATWRRWQYLLHLYGTGLADVVAITVNVLVVVFHALVLALEQRIQIVQKFLRLGVVRYKRLVLLGHLFFVGIQYARLVAPVPLSCVFFHNFLHLDTMSSPTSPMRTSVSADIVPRGLHDLRGFHGPFHQILRQVPQHRVLGFCHELGPTARFIHGCL